MKPHFFNHQLNAALPFRVDLIVSRPFAVPRIPDVHRAIHLAMVMEGNIEGMLGGHNFRFSAGDCYLTGYWEAHGGLRSLSGYRILLLTIEPEELERGLFTARDQFITLLTLPVSRRQQLVAAAGTADCIRQALPELLPSEDTTLFAQMEKRWLRINAIILHLLENLQLPPDAAQTRTTFQRLLPAMQLLARNDGARISAAEAAASCNLSISRFSHLWRDHFGNGFGAFELQYRFTQAVNELLRDDGTVKEVSAHWGFCDENHFARLFKSIYRSAPGRYRKLSESGDSQT